uniref:Uncharacterized protein n=1 Tax=Geospiza parvula TaxID=87175 RepID=A0A8C3MDD9_GEOPR
MDPDAPPAPAEPPALLKSYKWRTATPGTEPQKLGGSPGSRRWARLQGWRRSHSHPDTVGDTGGVAKASARRSLFRRAISAPGKVAKGEGDTWGQRGTGGDTRGTRGDVGYRRGHKGDTWGQRRQEGTRGDTPPSGTSPVPPLGTSPVPPSGTSPVPPDATVWDVSQFSLLDGHLVPLARDNEQVSGDILVAPGGGGISVSLGAVAPLGDTSWVPSRSGSRESLVPPAELDLTGDNVIVRPVHGSLVGERFCFQVITPGCSRSFGCSSLAERDRWIEELRRTAQPNKDNCERLDLSLSLFLSEGRHLPPRRRLRCHLQLDGAVFARTTAKPPGDDGQLFWGELFHLAALPPARALTVTLCHHRHHDPDGWHPLASVTIPLAELAAWQPLERWYTLSGAGGADPAPALRLRGRYRQVRVLPIVRYKELAEFITFHYRELCGRLEPAIAARHKEELAGALVRVLQSTGKAKVGGGGLGWVELGWVGLVELGWVGLGCVGLVELGWVGLGWIS